MESNGTYPRIKFTREGFLGRNVWEKFGSTYTATHSYDTMFTNRFVPYLRNLVNSIGHHMFGDDKNTKYKVEINVKPPESNIKQSKSTNCPDSQYNVLLEIFIRSADEQNPAVLWSHEMYIPAMVGSNFCKTKMFLDPKTGKYRPATALERREMGHGATDPGGYVINTKGNHMAVRLLEISSPFKPKIVDGQKPAEKMKKKFDSHSSSIFRRIKNFVFSLAERGVHIPAAEHYGYTQDDVDLVLADELEVVDTIELNRTLSEEPAKIPAPSPKAGKRTKRGAATENDEDQPSESVPTLKRRSKKTEVQQTSADKRHLACKLKLRNLSDVFLTAERKQRRDKSKTPKIPLPAVSQIIVRSTFENIHALSTVIEIFNCNLVYSVWISLPSTNEKVHFTAERYIPMITFPFKSREYGPGSDDRNLDTDRGGSLVSRLSFCFHVLFYARDFEKNMIKMEAEFYSVGLKSYEDEMMETILSVFPDEDHASIEAAFYSSLVHYRNSLPLLSPFDLFSSMYTRLPTDIHIDCPLNLVMHTTGFIIPLAIKFGTDPYIAKARALATMLLSHHSAAETGGSSNLQAYENKHIVTSGACIMRFVRDRINLLFWVACERDKVQSKTHLESQILKAKARTAILSSFKTRELPLIQNENVQRAVTFLQVETQLKTLMMTRTIVVPGSNYVKAESRLIQMDQAGNVCISYTPESSEVGKRKDLAALAIVTMYRDPMLITNFLEDSIQGLYDNKHKDFAEISKHIGELYSDIIGTDKRLLYIEGIPTYYISQEFFAFIKDLFLREKILANPDGTFSEPEQTDLEFRSPVNTFDIVFSSSHKRYTVFHSGGIVGHFVLNVLKNGTLAIDDPDMSADFEAKYGSKPWVTTNIIGLIRAGMLQLITPMEEYFECTSVAKFYATPSITDMPIENGQHTRDESIIRNCKELCPWCWHRADPKDKRTHYNRLDETGQRNPGKYADVIRCTTCDRRWHTHCFKVAYERDMIVEDVLSRQCPLCYNNQNFIKMNPVPLDFREDFDVCMIDPSYIFGASASTIPISEQTYGVRSAYQANMGLQSLDKQTEIDEKKESTSKQALEAQVPLATTELATELQHDCHNGINTMVASYMHGSNNEDGRVACETILRKCFRYAAYQTVHMSEQKTGKIKHNGVYYDVVREYMGICPSADTTKFHAIDEKTGLPKIGAFIRPGDAIYARYAITNTDAIVDQSLYCTIENYGQVEQVIAASLNASENFKITSSSRLAITTVMYYCYFEGDKICARYSQKGVIAKILPRKEMGKIVGGPFDGCVPDILEPPTMLPSRMTISYMTELAASKYALMTGVPQNLTSFRSSQDLPDDHRRWYGSTMDMYCKELRKLGCGQGFQNWCKQHVPDLVGEDVGFMHDLGGLMETLRLPNGKEEPVLFGPIRYLMLRHHAIGKIKRSILDAKRTGGDIFRQWFKGREGNLRAGYQEGQALFSAGIPETSKSIVHMGAKTTPVLACENCGQLVTVITSTTQTCPECEGPLLFINTIYSLLVLRQILATRGIDLRFYPTKQASD